MEQPDQSLSDLIKNLTARLNAPQYDVTPLARVVDSSIQALMQVKQALSKQQDRFEKDREQLLLIAASLELREEALLKREAELKREEAKVGDLFLQSQDQITLNVGGKIMTTSKATLTANSDSMLSAMFSGRHKLPTDDQGRYFIDRDPAYFSHVLNYLRDGKLRLPINDDIKDEEGVSIRSKIMDEFDFYCIPLKGVLKSTNFIEHRAFQAHEDKIRTMKIHNAMCVAGGDDGYIKFLDLNSGDNTFEFFNTGNVERLDYNGNLLAASVRNSDDEYLKLWDMGTKDSLLDLNVKNPIYWLKFLGPTLITAGYEINIFDLATMTTTHEFGKKLNLISWCMDADKDTIVTGQNDGTVAIWDPRAKSHTSLTELHQDGINDIKIRDDDIITASSDLTIKIFDMKMLRCKKILDAHTKSVFSLALVDNMIVSASCDKTVRLWEFETGNCCKTLFGSTRAVSCVDIAGADTIVSGAWDGFLRIWVAR